MKSIFTKIADFIEQKIESFSNKLARGACKLVMMFIVPSFCSWFFNKNGWMAMIVALAVDILRIWFMVKLYYMFPYFY